ncbi:LysR family transcriptional regulator [Pseudohalioglobus lutimaris]|uniref:LysR family transcriptional regulator n=1 Tax=Pseudohalioglobus lutimaris TaxID=1737061 RepID=A0A2N5X2S5_9GAMM|nr:LysR family transcriptional regulator [Pseudohalioglobus lutimaris]PLW68785.1 LysR family transcriptional regulator [Pseudohalioglobus lutimaris]
MEIRELGRLDLNLLVALEALLEERSVSRAAERLYITQSAMSKTLGRLRELFDDQLFVRRGSGMVPTPRAEQIEASLPDVLQAVQAMVRPLSFDPATYDGQMNILMQGHMGVWFLPALMARLQSYAPKMRVRAFSRIEDPFEQLSNGNLDFALQIERHHYPPDLELTTLAFARPVLLARRKHPLFKLDEVTLEDLTQYPHLSLLSTDISEVSFHEGDAEAVLEFERRAPHHYETDDLQTALEIVRKTDCLFPAPPMFIEQFNLSRYISAVPIPGIGDVSIKYVAVRHQRVIGSPAHDFFYEQIIELTEEIRDRLGLPDLPALRKQRKLAY